MVEFYNFTTRLNFSLLFSEPSDTYIRSQTFEGRCPLHLSVERGNLECVDILLKSGADPNQVTQDETTPLFLGEYGQF